MNMKPLARFTAVKSRSDPNIDSLFEDTDFQISDDYEFVKSLIDEKKYTYQDILDTAKALNEVRATGLTNMAMLKNVINILSGLGYEKEAEIITSIKEGKRFSIKFYHMMITMIDDNK